MTNKESPPCDFCKRYALNKFIKKEINKDRRANGESPINYELSVALVRRSWIDGTSKTRAGRTTDYRYRGIGYKLNYCPECGKYLRKGKKQT